MLQQTLPDVPALYPAEPPRAKLTGIRITELPVEPVQPPGWLVYSIKRRGILEPVTVLDYGDDGYKVKSGKRRVEAARKVGIKDVPAYVFDADDWKNGAAAALSLAGNNQRSNNAVDEYEAIVDLAVKRGISVTEIAEATGITVPSVKAALKLTALPQPILDAMLGWKVKYSVCRRIAALSYRAQVALVSTLEKDGTITARDVTPYYKAERGAIQVSRDLLNDPIHEWTGKSLSVLKAVLDEAPEGVPSKAMTGLGQVIDALEGASDPERAKIVAFKANVDVGKN
jgi:ParB/RepB/Spo0J family partition protein